MMAKWTRPTVETKFQIDFGWWEEEDRNFRTHLLSHLCSDCHERFKTYTETDMVDWIDPDTAQVKQVDGLWHSLRTCCSLKPGYIDERTPLTTAVFRTFLANGNEPLTAVELGSILQRPADTIVKTIGGLRIYHGIKPVVEE
jgi:hypothetical protein